MGISINDLSKINGIFNNVNLNNINDTNKNILYTIDESNQIDELEFSENSANIIDTLDELNSLLENPNKIASNELNAKINELNAKLEKYQAIADKLQTQLNEAEANKKQAESEKNKLEKELLAENKKLINHQKQKAELEAKAEEIQKAIEELNKIQEENSAALEKEVQKAEIETEKAKNEFIANLKASYNEEKDGDWESYLNKNMKNFSFTPSNMSQISSLKKEGINLQSKMNTLQDNYAATKYGIAIAESAIKTTKNNITVIKVEIETTKNTISKESENITKLTTDLKNTNTSIAEYKDSISEYKKQLNTTENSNKINAQKIGETEWKNFQNNFGNISEKLPDGSPRFVIAVDKNENAWHIYDMASNGKALVSNDDGTTSKFNGNKEEAFFIANKQTLTPLNTVQTNYNTIVKPIEITEVKKINDLNQNYNTVIQKLDKITEIEKIKIEQIDNINTNFVEKNEKVTKALDDMLNSFSDIMTDELKNWQLDTIEETTETENIFKKPTKEEFEKLLEETKKRNMGNNNSGIIYN